MRAIRFFAHVIACTVAGFTFAHAQTPAVEARWWKGNLHTHSLWSDGDDYPEMIADWYKQQGYQFLALSDHNAMQKGQRWLTTTNRGGGEVLQKYLARFGKDWVEQRQTNGQPQVRLKPLDEYRSLLEEPYRFLLIPSFELTDRYKTAPIHINVTNPREYLAPTGGSNVVEVMQKNVDNVLAQREATGQPMFPHLNHPNFGWGVTAEELMQVRGERFFEVYNGHPTVHNEGDATHASTDRMWDIMLTRRLTELNLEVIYGIGVDDSHNYHQMGIGQSNAGRGWVMVRTKHLTPESIVLAMEAGDFYASSGVTLSDVQRGTNQLSISIQAEAGVTYTTQFIGTRRSYDKTNEPIRTPNGEPLRVTHKYSAQLGEVFAEVTGTNAVYTLKGDEIYVRAKIVSSKPKVNGSIKDEFETAWVQPLVNTAK